MIPLLQAQRQQRGYLLRREEQAPAMSDIVKPAGQASPEVADTGCGVHHPANPQTCEKQMQT